MKERLCLLLFLFVAAGLNLIAASSAPDFERAESLARRTEGKVFRDVVNPRWLPDNRHLWYRVATGPDAHEFVLADAETGEIKRAATPEKLGQPKSERLSTSAQKSLAPT